MRRERERGAKLLHNYLLLGVVEIDLPPSVMQPEPERVLIFIYLFQLNSSKKKKKKKK